MAEYLPCVAYNQDQIAFAVDLFYYKPQSDPTNGPIVSVTQSVWLPSWSPNYVPRGGDNGHPVFAIINGELGLIGPWHSSKIADFINNTYITGSSNNNVSAYLGCQIAIASHPYTVAGLERFALSGNSNPHAMFLVDSQGINSWSCTVYPGSVLANSYASGFLALGAWPTVSPGSTNYVFSQEVNNGDYWYSYGNASIVSFPGLGSVNCASSSTDLRSFQKYGTSDQAYGPVSVLGFIPPICGEVSLPGAITNQINAILGAGYSVGVISLSGFPPNLR
jgi:hypothetical protein